MKLNADRKMSILSMHINRQITDLSFYSSKTLSVHSIRAWVYSFMMVVIEVSRGLVETPESRIDDRSIAKYEIARIAS